MPGLAYEKLQAHEITATRVALGVHQSNPVRKMSLDQVRQILLGKITNWSELGGKNQPIRVVAVGGGGGVVVGAVVVVGPTTVMVGGTPMVVAAAGEVVPEGELVAPFTTAASDEHDATPNVARINSTAAFLIAPPNVVDVEVLSRRESEPRVVTRKADRGTEETA